MPGLRDKSVVGFIHRVFGNEAAGESVDDFEELFGLIKDVSPDA
jgi:hypothetical protein